MENKMSKSLGNVIDPLHIIDGGSLKDLQKALLSSSLSEKEINKGLKDKQKQYPNGIPPCGSDSLRFSLLSYMIQPRSINVDPNVIISYRLFNNKIWNASKYIISQMPSSNKVSLKIDYSKGSVADKWILNKLNEGIQKGNTSLDTYEFGKYAQSFQFLNDLFDIYIEVSKKQIYDLNSDHCKQVLMQCLDKTLKLVAPAMPYITEEIYQYLNLEPEEKYESIGIAAYPTAIDYGVEAQEVDTISMQI